MNTAVTSKEALLSVAREIAGETGLQSLSVRKLAKRCGISVGTVYNYFPSKAELVSAAVESVWQEAFHGHSGDTISSHSDSFTDCVHWMYGQIQNAAADNPSFFTVHSMGFTDSEKNTGRRVMDHFFEHMKKGMLGVLNKDKNIREDAFNAGFSEQAFVDFVFSNMIASLVSKSGDLDILMEIIRRCLYEPGGKSFGEFV